MLHNLCIIITTTSTKDDANNIAQKLLHERLAACISMKQINSVYTWNNEIVDDIEYELSIKTTINHYKAIEELISSIHPYDVPQILCIKIDKSSSEYSNWLRHSI